MALLQSVPRRLLLTGTPATSRLFDSFNLFQVLRPGLLAANKYEYKARFFDGASSSAALKYPKQLPLLVHRFLMVRRTKRQVLLSTRPEQAVGADTPLTSTLPRQVMDDLPHRLDEQVDLPLALGHAREAIRAFGAAPLPPDDLARAEGGDADDSAPDSLEAAGVKAKAHRLGLLKAVALSEPESWLHARLRTLATAAADARQRGERPRKLVVFAHHERVMDLLEKTIGERLAGAATPASGGGDGESAPWHGVRIDGSHSGVAKNALLDAFRDNDSCLAALLSIKACGTGVDGLQHTADHAVFVELPETYALAHQAAARLHRSGQTQRVLLTWLLACGPPRRGRLLAGADAGDSGGDEASALLRECSSADARMWASLQRNAEEIDEASSSFACRSRRCAFGVLHQSCSDCHL